MNKIINRKIKMKPVDVKSGNFVEYIVYSNDNDPKFKKKKLKMAIMLEYQNIKPFLLNTILQIGQKKFL